MASTNKTTNYELSQFLGSDKPAWLADYNQDMSKIDTQMKANADGVTAVDGKADANTANIGDLTYLSTTAKNTLVAAINEIDSDVTTAQNTANSAASAAATANTNIAKFNLTNTINLSATTNKGTINTSLSNLQYAGDNTASVYKLYGRIYITNLQNNPGTLSVTLGQTPLRPSSDYTVNAGIILARNYTHGGSDCVPRNFVVHTDGSVTYTDTITSEMRDFSVILPPCLYFNTDFGDA